MRDWIYLGPPRTMRQITMDVAKAHGLRLADIYAPSRQKWVSHPRQEAMARMSWAGFSHPQIVRHFGLKDHTTSWHARRCVEARGLDYRVTLTAWQVWNIKSPARSLTQKEAA